MPTLLPLWRAARTTGKQCGLTATGDYQPSLRSPWLAASVFPTGVGVFWVNHQSTVDSTDFTH
ncbi:MAG: hypothetical protein RPU73_12990 [Candidatus Sedimenticola sp. (ex Thyasira tokunagai)]